MSGFCLPHQTEIISEDFPEFSSTHSVGVLKCTNRPNQHNKKIRFPDSIKSNCKHHTDDYNKSPLLKRFGVLFFSFLSCLYCVTLAYTCNTYY